MNLAAKLVHKFDEWLFPPLDLLITSVFCFVLLICMLLSCYLCNFYTAKPLQSTELIFHRGFQMYSPKSCVFFQPSWFSLYWLYLNWRVAGHVPMVVVSAGPHPYIVGFLIYILLCVLVLANEGSWWSLLVIYANEIMENFAFIQRALLRAWNSLEMAKNIWRQWAVLSHGEPWWHMTMSHILQIWSPTKLRVCVGEAITFILCGFWSFNTFTHEL